MKRHLKWGIILFCTALSFGLAGCGKEEESMKEALERVRDAEEAEDSSADFFSVTINAPLFPLSP